MHTDRTWPDLFVIKHFLEPPECERIVAEIKAAPASAATLYGRGASRSSIDTNVRKALRVTPTPEIIEAVSKRLLSCRPAIEKHFQVILNDCEDPQFLRYAAGDFFVAHQDGNTGLVRLESESRLVSVVIFLSQQSEIQQANYHRGGSLVFIAPADRDRFHVPAEVGTLIAFRSETTHEVTPVTCGERLSIVSWYRRI